MARRKVNQRRRFDWFVEHACLQSRFMRDLSTAMLGAALTLVIGCSSPPGATPPPPFEWEVALRDLDDAILSMCEGGDRLLAVGGTTRRAAIYEWRDTAWHAAELPAESQLLWWCWIDEGGTAWAVGEDATVLSSPATSAWSRRDVSAALPDDLTLFGVWGSGPTDIHVVGGSITATGNVGASAHFDGAAWQRTDTGLSEVLFKVWGSGPSDVWAVGTGGIIEHFDGAAWSAVAPVTGDRLIAVWGTGADDVYAVGGDGVGRVLHYDGASWAEFATTAERLSGVWTARGEPLYVAGDRGFVARFELGPSGAVRATEPAIAVPLATVDFHSMTAVGDTIVAAGADLAGGNAAHWAGAVVTHRGSRAGALVPAPLADAAPPDAPRPDATIADAAPLDATPLPGPGEPCAMSGQPCAQGLECWLLQASQVFVCTEACTLASECTDPGYGVDPCCHMPGFQTLETVCIDRAHPECEQ
jgi:hypothetical protein